MKILVTGGAGFIGSHFIRRILKTYPDCEVINLDKLTYAGCLENLRDVEGNERYRFVKGDICNSSLVQELAARVDCIANFAAETHVDRSVLDPGSFIKTDIEGTYTLLEAARRFGHKRFLQVSTDEVYGSIASGSFTEQAPLNPSSPYSASKAGADLLVLSYHRTFGLPAVITRSSNNFGPNQHPEKFIPLFITNALDNKKLPLYGSGENVRDWIYVEDNCEAIDLVLHRGEPGGIYNIGAGREMKNIDVVRLILEELEKPWDLVRFVTDRPAHDLRYSLDTKKIRALGFRPRHNFMEALKKTVQWYMENRPWWEVLKSGEFESFYSELYGAKKESDRPTGPS